MKLCCFVRTAHPCVSSDDDQQNGVAPQGHSIRGLTIIVYTFLLITCLFPVPNSLIIKNFLMHASTLTLKPLPIIQWGFVV